MHFELSQDQQDIQRTARDFLAARYPLEEVRRLAIDDERGWTDAQWAEIAGLGWPGLAVPEEHGGQGLGTVELAVVAEELGYALAPSPLQSTWAAALLLSAAGGHESLAALAEGTERGAIVFLDGIAGDAEGAAVGVTIEGEAGPLTLGERVTALDPTRRLHRVEFSGSPVGDVSRGVGQMTVACAAESVGIAQRCMEMSVAYAKDRKQFGRPIGTNQAVSHACAQMLLEVEGARSLVHYAAWTLDVGHEDAPAAVAMAKAYASDAGFRVAGSAIQVHGGIGFTWEHDLHFFFKRARANAAVWGDPGSQRDQVAGLALA
jgi:alkylation response protein AidB-like acyl-CoA dehydrogenase